MGLLSELWTCQERIVSAPGARNFEMAVYEGSFEGTLVDPNPWSGRSSALGINLGDPARLLTVGRKHGLLPATTIQVYVLRLPILSEEK